MKKTAWEDKDYRNYRGKWKTKGEYNDVKYVRERFGEMETARRTSCVWSDPDGIDSIEYDENSRGGSDWAKRWRMDDKLAYMYKEYISGRTNLKSSTSFAPIQAAMAEFEANPVGVLISSTLEGEDINAKVHKYLEDDWYSRYDVADLEADSFLDTLTKGTGITFNAWQLETKEVEIIKSLDDKETIKLLKMRDEEIEAMKTKLLKEEKPLTEKSKIIVQNNAISVPVSLYEIYVDPSARTLTGPMYKAADIVWRQELSENQFQQEYKNTYDSYIIKDNVCKVKGYAETVASYGATEPLFLPPGTLQEDKVEVLRYYNTLKDEYYIVANDILIRKGPLPYNHKELPFSRHRYFRIKDQFYGAGLPVVLESSQAEEETLKNMNIDQQKITANPPIFVNTDIYADVEEGYDIVVPGKLVEISGSVGTDNVRWFEGPQSRLDYYRMRDVLKEEAVSISGINPIQFAAPTEGAAVRNNIMAMESSLKMVKRGIAAWAIGKKNSVRQRIRMREQLLSQSYVEQICGDKVKKVYPVVRTKDKKISIYGNEVKEERKEGYWNLDLKQEYLSITGELDLQLDIDSLVPRTHGLKIQQIEQAMVQLLPVLSNPMLLMAPGVMQIVRDYIKLHGLSARILEELKDESTEDARKRALEQEEKILNGELVDGIPGESSIHLAQHAATLIGLLNQKDMFMTETVQMGAIGEMGGPPQEIVAEIEDLTQDIKALSQHIAIDDTPKEASVSTSLEASKQMTQPPEAAPQEPQNDMTQLGAPEMPAPGQTEPAPMPMTPNPTGIPNSAQPMQ